LCGNWESYGREDLEKDVLELVNYLVGGNADRRSWILVGVLRVNGESAYSSPVV
jgi:hypothetical protein